LELDQRYANACLQILRDDDLSLPEDIVKSLQKKPFAAEIITDKDGVPYLKLYGKQHFLLSQIVPLLKNIGLTVHSEISYEIPFETSKVNVSRYRIANEQLEEINHTQRNILELLETMLCNPTLPNTALLQLTLLENISPRELELLVALIAYENQLVPAFNEMTMTNILIKHHSVTKSLLDYFNLKFNPSINIENGRWIGRKKK